MSAHNGFALNTLSNGPAVGRFSRLTDLPGVGHVVTTNHWPDPQAIKRNPDEVASDVCDALGASGLAWLEQVHGGEVLAVESPGCAGRADALMTDVPGLAVAGKSADCPLILLADRVGRA